MRLLEGTTPQHVLEAIFKALGVALAQACRPNRRRRSGDKTVVRTEEAPAPFQGAPYSQAIAAGGLVFVSGQLALKPGDKELSAARSRSRPSRCSRTSERSSRRRAAASTRLVKTTVFLQNLDDFQGMNEVYSKHVGEQPPARATVEVAKLPSGALVEIEAIALKRSP